MGVVLSTLKGTNTSPQSYILAQYPKSYCKSSRCATFEAERPKRNQNHLLYSWCFSPKSVPIHWLVHGHMTSSNETVSCQMPWVDNIAKYMTSNGKQCIVTREMLTAVARDRWNLSAVFKFCFCFVLLYNKSLNDLREQWILFPLNLNVSPRHRLGKHWDSRETKFTVPLRTSH